MLYICMYVCSLTRSSRCTWGMPIKLAFKTLGPGLSIVMTAPVTLDVDTFLQRLQRFRTLWKRQINSNDGSSAEKFDVAMFTLGGPSDMTIYQKTTAMFTWFLGYEFPETVMIIGKEVVIFIATVRKCVILDVLAAKDPSIKVLRREKEPGKGEPAFKTAWESIKQTSTSPDSIKVGILAKDKNDGPMTKEWLDYSLCQSYEAIDIAAEIGTILATKDEKERQLLNVASKATSLIFNGYYSRRILNYIDDGKRISHIAITEEIESSIMKQLSRMKNDMPPGTNVELMDICYPPIIQSGGTYSLKPSAISNDDNLAGKGFIVSSIGLRYRSYCANMARTFLIDGAKDDEAILAFAYDLQKHVASLLKSGVVLSSVFAAGMEYVREKRPDLEKHVVANFGFGIGLEFRAPEYLINARCNRRIAEGMTFNLVVGFQDLFGGKGAVMLADTVMCRDDSSSFMTFGLSELGDVSFSLSTANKPISSRIASTPVSDSIIKTRLRSQTGPRKDENTEKKRREHQKELGVLRVREALERYASSEGPSDGKCKEKVQKFESYRKEALLPKDLGVNGSIKVNIPIVLGP